MLYVFLGYPAQNLPRECHLACSGSISQCRISSRLESHCIPKPHEQIKRRQCWMLAIKEDNYFFFFLQELSNRLDDVTQEKSNLLSKVSGLEESISSADQERKTLEDKMNAFSEGKDEVEKKLASVTESLETEKQVFECWLFDSL